MKKFNIPKLSKETRAAVLLIIGLLLIGTTAIASNKLIKSDEIVYQPTVTSNYQPQETQPSVDDAKKPVVPVPVSTPEKAKWPVTYTMEQAASLTVVVNKKHKLPSSYVPALQSVAGGQLRPEAANALASMFADAEAAGLPMKIISSYRSYNTQVSTYNKWVKVDGQAQADRSSARPGHSEHQTGLAVDVGMPDGSCSLLICFGSKPQGIWVAENAHKYGFIVRYESDTESITGYQYEPWHLRYLGVETAAAVKNSGKTLDQYYSIEAGGY